MSPPRAIRVTLQEAWRRPGHRGLLDVDPRVRTLCRVLVSYPEVRHILPDRVSVDAVASAEVLETMSRFLSRQRWLVSDVEIV
ncbi:MAG TPA: hypothetical protein VGW35_06210 [Methylomirabilota bacterium]|jgi:hypothetical protein|nr:hypothetical protein [Methylomirabilota bacterium]